MVVLDDSSIPTPKTSPLGWGLCILCDHSHLKSPSLGMDVLDDRTIPTTKPPSLGTGLCVLCGHSHPKPHPSGWILWMTGPFPPQTSQTPEMVSLGSLVLSDEDESREF